MYPGGRILSAERCESAPLEATAIALIARLRFSLSVFGFT